MPTNYLHRLLIVCTNARKASLTTWWVNNVDPNGSNTFNHGLSASGSAPATHWWACVGLTNADARQALNRWYAIAGVSAPNWNTMTRAEIRAQVASDWNALVAGSGIRIWHSDNDANWDDFQDRRSGVGLQKIQVADVP